MKKFLLLFTFLILFLSCKEQSKVEQAVENTSLKMKVVRFEQAFFNAKPSQLASIKAEFPDFFPPNTPDEVWLEKLQHPQWRELYNEVEKKYGNFSSQQLQIEELFKRIKFYFPTIQTPVIYTVIGEMDYNNKVIYANDKLLIALELYLGNKHKFYSDFPEYITQNFTESQMLPDVVASFANGIVPQPRDKTLISQMVYHGKQLYLKDILLSDTFSDADKIGYTSEQITWSKDNEYFIWMNFLENQYLYSTNPKLLSQFINLAPFSKFYLEIDNQSPGRIGQWIGWQIVRYYMENNPKTSVQQLLKMDAKTLFEASLYKPSKNE
jgi:gliding motility-associated lipoprotein GldB